MRVYERKLACKPTATLTRDFGVGSHFSGSNLNLPALCVYGRAVLGSFSLLKFLHVRVYIVLYILYIRFYMREWLLGFKAPASSSSRAALCFRVDAAAHRTSEYKIHGPLARAVVRSFFFFLFLPSLISSISTASYTEFSSRQRYLAPINLKRRNIQKEP